MCLMIATLICVTVNPRTWMSPYQPREILPSGLTSRSPEIGRPGNPSRSSTRIKSGGATIYGRSTRRLCEVVDCRKWVARDVAPDRSVRSSCRSAPCVSRDPEARLATLFFRSGQAVATGMGLLFECSCAGATEFMHKTIEAHTDAVPVKAIRRENMLVPFVLCGCESSQRT